MQKISVYYRKSLHTNCMLNKDMVCDYVSPTHGRDIGTYIIYTYIHTYIYTQMHK